MDAAVAQEGSGTLLRLAAEAAVSAAIEMTTEVATEGEIREQGMGEKYSAKPC
jgi:hypothetical protein